jgi:hypothetical protein
VSTVGGFLDLCLLFLRGFLALCVLFPLLRGQNPHPAPPVAVGPPKREPDAAPRPQFPAAARPLSEDWHRRAGQMRST